MKGKIIQLRHNRKQAYTGTHAHANSNQHDLSVAQLVVGGEGNEKCKSILDWIQKLSTRAEWALDTRRNKMKWGKFQWLENNSTASDIDFFVFVFFCIITIVNYYLDDDE